MARGPKTRRIWDDRAPDGELGPVGWRQVKVVTARCGRCHRPLAEVGDGIGPAGGEVAVRRRSSGDATPPYPGQPRAPIDLQRHHAAEGRVKLPCHPKRCRAEWTVRLDRLGAAASAALDAGRGEVVIPYDLRG